MKKLRKEYCVFSSLFLLQAKYWFASRLNIFLGVFVSLYMMICWLGFKSGDPFLMVSGVCVAMVRNALYIYLRTIIDWKDKDFKDKLTLIDINDKTKHASLFMFNFVSTFFICLLLFLISIACFPHQLNYLKQTNGLMLMTGLILCWITCYLLALFIYNFVNNSKWAVMIGMLIYFSSTYFLGLGFPFETIVKVGWLNDFLYLHPMRYAINIAQAGYVNASNFHYIDENPANLINVDFGYNEIWWLPYLLAISVIICYLSIICIKIFIETDYKFKSRSKLKILKSESKTYIKLLKETDDIVLLQAIREDRREKVK